MDKITTRVFSGCRSLCILAVFAIGISLAACGGSQTKQEDKGSLSRTFSIMDEQGRNAGTLTIDPVGGAVLRDENGSVMGTFKTESPAKVEPAEEKPAEAQP